jgi:GRASP55/65 PDZ-like domain
VFSDSDALHDELVAHLEQPMEIYVYSTKTDQVRVIVLMPTVTWGGSGCLGAEVGHGYLHTLPEHCRHSTGSSTGDGLMMMSAPDAMVSPVQAWRNDSTTNSSSFNSSSGTGVAQRHFPATDHSNSSGSSSTAGGTAASHSDSTTTAAAAGVAVSSTPEQQQQQRQQLHQQWQQLQQQTAVDAKPPQQSVTDSAVTAAVAQRDSSQSLNAQQQQLQQQPQQQPQQQQQRPSIDYSSIDLSSIGGVIDVDLSGTATQVAPHVRARG